MNTVFYYFLLLFQTAMKIHDFCIPSQFKHFHQQLSGLKAACSQGSYTVCPRSSDPFYIVIYYIKWATSPWTHSIRWLLRNTSASMEQSL